VECRVKLSRDTGANLTTAACEELLGKTFERAGGEQEQLSPESNPGLFYTNLGKAIADQSIALGLPDHLMVAWWCHRESAEVHQHPVGMKNRFAVRVATGSPPPGGSRKSSLPFRS
jgi:hypothetical protein